VYAFVSFYLYIHIYWYIFTYLKININKFLRENNKCISIRCLSFCQQKRTENICAWIFSILFFVFTLCFWNVKFSLHLRTIACGPLCLQTVYTHTHTHTLVCWWVYVNYSSDCLPALLLLFSISSVAATKYEKQKQNQSSAKLKIVTNVTSYLIPTSKLHLSHDSTAFSC